MTGTIADRIEKSLGGKPKKALAKELGCKPSQISRWLDGAKPSGKYLVKLARALSVDLGWLITGEVTAPNMQDSEYNNPNREDKTLNSESETGDMNWKINAIYQGGTQSQIDRFNQFAVDMVDEILNSERNIGQEKKSLKK